MPKYTLATTRDSYLSAWDAMQINDSVEARARKVADDIIALKPRYVPIEAATGVPWYFIGLLHLRESNFNFDTHLHNGDPLNAGGRARRTVHVPKGRPVAPPNNGVTYTFEESAIDALRVEFGKVKSWDIPTMAYYLELYNGFGYRMRGIASPYLWAGSNQYIKGKYIRDGVFDPTAVDSQLGTMVVLKLVLDNMPITSTITILDPPTDPPISPAADLIKPSNKELRKTSRKFRAVEWLQQLFGWTTGVTATVTTLDATQINATKTFIDSIKGFVVSHGVFILIFALIIGFIATNYIKKWMKEDVEQGRYDPSGESK
jgi:lysozyme family protein